MNSSVLPDIILDEVTFGWGNRLICDRLTLRLHGGKTTAFLGSSGIGKSTLLRLVAGLSLPQRGAVLSASGHPLSSQIAWMGQQDNLYPWLNVRDNVTVSARLAGKKADDQRAEALLRQVQLSGSERAMPASLSGGMRQRVALARTLYQDRPVVLMDEPFAMLDVMTRLQLQTLTGTLLQGKTVLLVTHDPLEACRLAHNIVLLSRSPLHHDVFPVPDGDVPRNLADAAVLEAQGNLFQRLTHNEK